MIGGEIGMNMRQFRYGADSPGYLVGSGSNQWRKHET